MSERRRIEITLPPKGSRRVLVGVCMRCGWSNLAKGESEIERLLHDADEHAHATGHEVHMEETRTISWVAPPAASAVPNAAAAPRTE